MLLCVFTYCVRVCDMGVRVRGIRGLLTGFLSAGGLESRYVEIISNNHNNDKLHFSKMRICPSLFLQPPNTNTYTKKYIHMNACNLHICEENTYRKHKFSE